MKLHVKLASLLLLAALVFVPLQTAAAKGLEAGKILFGQSITLTNGETMSGDLVVFGGSATLQEGAVVEGNVLLFGGNLVVDGEVTGDVAVTGGTIILGARSHVHGNLTTVGTSLDQASGAQVDGQIYNTATTTTWSGIETGTTPLNPNLTNTMQQLMHINFFDPFGAVLSAFGKAVGLGLLAMLLMLFLAPHAQRVAHAITVQPLTAGGFGLLTVLVAPLAIAVMAITLILIPVALVAATALVVVALFGWIAAGLEVGQRFTQAIHQEWHPAFSAGLGTFALSLVAAALTGIPVISCIGWLLPAAVGLAAIGAVLMTRFGTQLVSAPVRRPSANPPVPPAAGAKPS